SDGQQQQAGLDVEFIDDVLEDEGHHQVKQLGGEYQSQGQQDAAQVGAQIGQQVAYHGEVAARLLGAFNRLGAGLLRGGTGRHYGRVLLVQRSGCLCWAGRAWDATGDVFARATSAPWWTARHAQHFFPDAVRRARPPYEFRGAMWNGYGR